MIRRRDFIRMTVVSAAASTSAHTLVACGGDDDDGEVFPQSVASGDPRPDSIVLWTRVPGSGPQTVTYELAEDEAFERVAVQGELETDADADHTVRLKVTDLSPFTTYYYRFSARGKTSPVGRTKTAPAEDADVPVRLALTSCQEYVGRWFHAWRVLVEQDDVDFVLFLGDYIYETDNLAGASDPRPGREISFADGLPFGGSYGSATAALSLEDYRSLYRTYRGDPDLQEAHRLFPFVVVWDDHEFANDAWQDRSNHFDGAMGDEQNTARREAATQAWVEYLPVDVEHRPELGFPNDVTIYRSFRYGRHVELFLTDQRYYRDDHLIPEGPIDAEVGKIAENSILGSRILGIKEVFDAREAAAAPSMLGAEQRDWLIDAVSASDATWKLIGSQTMFAQHILDLRLYVDLLPTSLLKQFYFKMDQWDGFRTERRQILEALAARSNVVVLTGDLHAAYAGRLKPDFDDAASPATAVEYVVPGISAISLGEQLQLALETDPLLRLLPLDELVADADRLFADANPNLDYVRNRTYGYAVVEVDADVEVRVTYVEVDGVTTPDRPAEAQRTSFRTPSGESRIEPL